jgi:hypothetical protein
VESFSPFHRYSVVGLMACRLRGVCRVEGGLLCWRVAWSCLPLAVSRHAFAWNGAAFGTWFSISPKRARRASSFEV